MQNDNINKKSKRVSMRDIAEKLGISKVSVCLALNGAKNVSEQTRKKVFETAEKLGYKKDALISTVMSNIRLQERNNFCETIAIINANKDENALQKYPIFSKYISGIKSEADNLGYAIYEVWLHNPNLNERTLGNIMKARGIRGGIILAHTTSDSLSSHFESIWNKFKFVSAGIKTRNSKIDFVCADKFLIARRAAEKAIELGNKRLGFVMDKDIDDIVDGRFSGGFLYAQLSLPMEFRIPPFLDVAAARKDINIFKKWLNTFKPEAILSLSNYTSEWLENLSGKISQPLRIIKIDCPSENSEWIGMDSNYELVGRMAVRRLSEIVNRAEGINTINATTATVVLPNWTDNIKISIR